MFYIVMCAKVPKINVLMGFARHWPKIHMCYRILCIMIAKATCFNPSIGLLLQICSALSFN